MLAKGRRNIGESRHQAALREMKEETGYSCHILPLTMTTRAPPAIEIGQCADVSRVHENVCEPFMLTYRQLDARPASLEMVRTNEGRNVKIIWWYIAAIDEAAEVGAGEEQFDVRLVSFEEAVGLLTFEDDREIVRKAIEIIEGQ